MWLKEFKLAIIKEDSEKIAQLIKEVPTFDKVIDMTEALYLIKEADTLIKRLQDESQELKNKLKKHIDFLKSTQNDTPSNLDTSQ